jgi:hypothetical protein
VGVLNRTHDRLAVVRGIEESREGRERLVNSLYLRLLGREAEPAALARRVAQLQGGATQEDLMADILASAEFRARAQLLIGTGSEDERFIRALYLVLLGRSASASEVNGWLGALPGLGARGVASAFLHSREFRTLEVTALYATLLQRRPDAAGLNGWVNSGRDLLSIREGIEASEEFATQ